MTGKRLKPPKRPPAGTPPPVRHVPLKPPIERIPFFGRSWVKRGAAYWILRVLAGILLFIVLGLSCGMTFSIAYGLWVSDLPIAAKIVIYAHMLAAIIRSSIKAWSAFIIVGRSNRTDAPMTLAEAAGDSTSPSSRRSKNTSAAFRGTTAWLAGGAAGGLLVISFIVNLGWVVVMFASAFQKYYGLEYPARVRLQQWCGEQGVTSPLRS